MVEIDYEYDYELDILNIHVTHCEKYKESVKLGTGIYLDFDINNNISNLEIIDASQVLNIKKEYLKQTNMMLK